MLTLKFCNSYEDGTSSQAVMSCSHFNVYRFSDRVEITLYKDYTSVDGVTYTLSEKDIERPYWQCCFVENSSGKTIDRISPLQ